MKKGEHGRARRQHGLVCLPARRDDVPNRRRYLHAADLRHRHPTEPKLHTMLQRWVTQSLITPAEADAIEAFEGRETTSAQRGVPLLTEALIYARPSPPQQPPYSSAGDGTT